MSDAARSEPADGRGGTRSAAGGRSPWLIAAVVSIATFMEVLDISIANVSLRHIAGSLAAGADESTWILTSYLISNAVVLPVAGWLASVIGRKRFYMLAVALFTISSGLCAIAPSLSWLIFFRVLQGIGGGGLAPSEQSILADTFPEQQRGLAFSIYGLAVVVAPTLGPTFGGWITDSFSWHWIFLINLPMGLLSLSLVQMLVVEPKVLEEERRHRLSKGLRVDYIGFVLVALWLGCLEVVLDRGQQEDWFASSFITTFALISFVSLLLLVPWELSRKEPIVDVRLLFTHQLGLACLVMLAVGAILFSSTQILPQMLQANFGYTPTLSGLALMPAGLVMLTMMPLAGFLSGKLPARYLIAGGTVVVALAMWHFTSLSPQADFGFFARARIYQMVALPLLFLPVTTASYAGLPPDKTGEASSFINVARNLGGSIGISLCTTLLAQREQFHHSRLVEHVTPANPAYQAAVKALGQQVVEHGATPSASAPQALATIARKITLQSSLLSYVEVFAALGLVALLIIPVAFLIRNKGGEGAAS